MCLGDGSSCFCKEKTVFNTFKIKGSKGFEVKCEGTVQDQQGNKYDQWRVTCSNFNDKNFIPKIWPFEDGSGSSTFQIKHPKSGQTCKKVLAKNFKTNRNIRCEHDESKFSGCQCSEFAERIASESNTAKNEVLALTAACSKNQDENKEFENWDLHCDRNGNGIVDEDEKTGTVRLITKPNSNYCKIKKTVSSDLKCTKPSTSSCLCEDFFKDIKQPKEFKKEYKNGIKIKVKCISGDSKHDKYKFSATKNGIECETEKVSWKHSNVMDTCKRKMLSNVKNFVKKGNFIKNC